MAKSRIIKDLANGTIDTITALKRVKVLLSEIDNPEVKKWIDYEITGYPVDVPLPDYRIARGTLLGSYIKGSMSTYAKWENVSIPLGKMPKDLQNNLLRIEFRESAGALNQLVERFRETNSQIGTEVPADYFPIIAQYNNDPYMVIYSARVVVSEQSVARVFSVVESRLLDVLLLLENEFGNLDDLDLDVTTKTTEDLNCIAQKIVLIIYNDQRVSMGDNNKIRESTIASSME